MSKKIIYVQYPPYPPYYQPKRPYGCFMFLMDAFLIVVTCGLWIIVIIWREGRS